MADVVATLQTISKDLGYNRTFQTVCEQGAYPNTPLWDVISVTALSEQKTDTVAGKKTVFLTLELVYWVREKKAENVGAAIHNAAFDIEKALKVDPKRGGWAGETDVVSTQSWPVGDNATIGGGAVTVEVQFRHQWADPGTK